MVFLGYVFKCSTGEIPVVTDSDLWQMFHDNLVLIWNDGRTSAVEVDYYFECKSERPTAINFGVSKNFCKKDFPITRKKIKVAILNRIIESLNYTIFIRNALEGYFLP